MHSKVYTQNHPNNKLPDNSIAEMLKNADPLSFHQSLSEYSPTPLHSLDGLAKSAEVGKIYVKDESHRFGLNAFKAMGASFALHQVLSGNPDAAIICTATDGNHGRAVAWSAARMDKKAVIFVPKGTVDARIKAIENEGAEVFVVDGHYDQACKEALDYSLEYGALLVQDTAWEGYEEIPAWVLSGYFTHFMELENTLHTLPNASVDMVFLQAGVGTWAASAVWYYLQRYGENRPKLILVEPFASDGIFQSFKNGHRSLPSGNQQTIMAGLNCGIPSLTAWDILKAGIDYSVLIEDSHVEMAMRQLYHSQGSDPTIISGESGAAGMAAFLAIIADAEYGDLKKRIGINASSRILLFNTEGDTDPINFDKIVHKI